MPTTPENFTDGRKDGHTDRQTDTHTDTQTNFGWDRFETSKLLASLTV